MKSVVDGDVQFWRGQEHIQFASGIVNVEGHDGRRVLRTQDRKYVAVSSISQPILTLLGRGVPGCALFSILEVSKADQHNAERHLAQFLNLLREKSLLNIPSNDNEPARERVLVQARREFFLKLIKSRFLALAFSRAGLRLRPVSAWFLGVLLLALPIAGVMVTVSIAFPRVTVPTFPVVLGAGIILVFHLFVHESFHAIAMGYFKLEVRDMGLGLAWLVFPVAFVDRSDAYTLKSRFGRASIALIGPACDGTLSGIAALLGATLPHPISSSFTLAAILQLYLLLANLNPLFRTDGYHALESFSGATNIRSRAITFVLSMIMHVPLPTYLKRVSPWAKAGYIIYILAGILYIFFFGLMVVLGVRSLVDAS